LKINFGMKRVGFYLIFFVALSSIISSCNKPGSGFDDLNEFKKDTAAIEVYFKNKKINATKINNGVWFIIDSASSGFRATYYDTVALTYSTKLLPSEATVETASTPTSFSLYQILNGVQASIPQFPKGSKGRIFMASYYAYGNKKVGEIPANSNLIFEFKLLDVKDYRLKKDTAAIGFYLRDNAIPTQLDPSGIRYSVTSIGTGIAPEITDSVRVNFKLYTLPSGQLITQSTAPATFLLSDLILGWQIGLPLIREDGKISLYVPSSLAYGPNAYTGIPAYSSLNYYIELIKVIQNK
jgi:FKBP-type peptidyl-prolyl cis-trans isomerase FkpA